jgi:hypothetical protein
MSELLTFLFYGIVGGPALALSYGLPVFGSLSCFTALGIEYIISIVVIQLLLSKFGLQHRFKNKIFSKASRMVRERGRKLAIKMDDFAGKFNKELGDVGFYLALTSFTFLFGVYWAGVVAFLLEVELSAAISSMSVGAILAVGFWTYIIVRTNISAEAVTLFFSALTVIFIAYGFLKEQRTITVITERLTAELDKLI